MENKIEFHTTDSTLHNTWVMRITADRKIEVNEDVNVTFAAQKVLDAMQGLLTPQHTWAELTDKEILSISNENYTNNKGSRIEFARAVLRKAQEPAEKNLMERYAREMKSRNWISFDDWVREISPPKRTWVGLTDEDCKGMGAGDKVVAMWADRTLKEKNT